jgi:hypothetical protein
MVTLNECCILLVFLIRCDVREPSCETENLAVKFCMLTSESTSSVLIQIKTIHDVQEGIRVTRSRALFGPGWERAAVDPHG